MLAALVDMVPNVAKLISNLKLNLFWIKKNQKILSKGYIKPKVDWRAIDSPKERTNVTAGQSAYGFYS